VNPALPYPPGRHVRFAVSSTLQSRLSAERRNARMTVAALAFA